jgi:hypothetical protein
LRNRLVALLVVLSLGALAAPAQAGTTLNLLAGTEFGRGVGAGLELGGTDTFVVGAGVALGAGVAWGPSQALEPSIALTISVGLPL